tara:strand:+ start:645 stop:896 length:252 start_codon:yes stop_codon:yes gene_type:complete
LLWALFIDEPSEVVSCHLLQSSNSEILSSTSEILSSEIPSEILSSSSGIWHWLLESSTSEILEIFFRHLEKISSPHLFTCAGM